MNKNNNKIEALYSQDKQTLTIKVTGQFTFSRVSEFRKSYETKPAVYYNLDLAGVTKFDSAGLGCILVMFEHIKDNTQQACLNICNADNSILEIFECAKVSDLLNDIQFGTIEPVLT